MAFSCDTCGRTNKNDTLCEKCGASAPGADPNRVHLALQRDRIMEAHLGALSIVYRAGAVLTALVAAWALIAFLHAPRGMELGADLAGLWAVFGVVALAFGAGYFVFGHFLGRHANWARIVLGVLASITLAFCVLSSLKNLIFPASELVYNGDGYSTEAHVNFLGFFLSLIPILWWISVTWALLSRRSAAVCAPGYRDLIARTSDVRAPVFRSPFFVVPTICTGAVVAVALLITLLRFASSVS